MTIDESTTPAPRRSLASRAGAVGSGAVLVGGAASALLVALTAAPGGATGTTLTVDSLGDGPASGAHCVDGTPGNCTLRDALAEALDGDTIAFDGALSGVITLTNGALPVDHGVFIDGTGASNITIDANHLSRIFTISAVSSAVTIDGLTLTHGHSLNDPGGAISAAQFTAPITLSNLVITANTVVGGLGGGVWVRGSGDVTIVDTIVSDNVGQSSRGGGMFLFGTSQSGTILVRNTTIADNSANDAGGLYVQSAGPVQVANSTIVGNHATTGQGGGLLEYGTANFRMDQTTIANNSAAAAGGGTAFADSVTVTGSIVSGNTSGVAGREDLASYGGSAITVTSQDSLFFTVAPSVTVSGSGNITGVDPQLSPLAFNGGATPTMALASTSPAVDSGPASVASFPGNTYDQRGPGFDRVVGGHVDMGAFEFGAVPAPTTTTTSTTSTTSGGGQVVPTFTG